MRIERKELLMKKNLMVWALVICCAFSGCGNSSDVKKTTDQSGAVAGGYRRSLSEPAVL